MIEGASPLAAGAAEPVPGDVCAFLVDVGVASAAVALLLEDVLSDDEVARARRIRTDAARARFAGTRAALREVLGAYLDVPPSSLRFRRGPHGKPTLAGGGAAERLRFNVSHSGTVAAVAVSPDRDVGVDVERVAPERVSEDVAAHVLTPAEQATLECLDGPRKVDAFFRAWTAKEAYLKALGTGLVASPKSIELPRTPSMPGRPVALEGGEDAGCWALHSFWPGPHYAGAVVASGSDWRLWTRRWRLGCELAKAAHDDESAWTWSHGGGI